MSAVTILYRGVPQGSILRLIMLIKYSLTKTTAIRHGGRSPGRCCRVTINCREVPIMYYSLLPAGSLKARWSFKVIWCDEIGSLIKEHMLSHLTRSVLFAVLVERLRTMHVSGISSPREPLARSISGRLNIPCCLGISIWSPLKYSLWDNMYALLLTPFLLLTNSLKVFSCDALQLLWRCCIDGFHTP